MYETKCYIHSKKRTTCLQMLWQCAPQQKLNIKKSKKVSKFTFRQQRATNSNVQTWIINSEYMLFTYLTTVKLYCTMESHSCYEVVYHESKIKLTFYWCIKLIINVLRNDFLRLGYLMLLLFVLLVSSSTSQLGSFTVKRYERSM